MCGAYSRAQPVLVGEVPHQPRAHGALHGHGEQEGLSVLPKLRQGKCPATAGCAPTTLFIRTSSEPCSDSPSDSCSGCNPRHVRTYQGGWSVHRDLRTYEGHRGEAISQDGLRQDRISQDV